MRSARLDLDSYVGVDVVQELVDENNRRYGSSRYRFVKLDLTCQQLPRSDLIVCRDLLIHLSFRHALSVLRNFQRSGSTYLLCSNSPDQELNAEIVTGSFRPLNLRAAPFTFASPERELSDCSSSETTPKSRKTMALWRLQDLKLG